MKLLILLSIFLLAPNHVAEASFWDGVQTFMNYVKNTFNGAKSLVFEDEDEGKLKVEFYIVNAHDTFDEDLIQLNNQKLFVDLIPSTNQIKILVHDWMENKKSNFTKGIAKAFFNEPNNQNVTIIAVDYKEIAVGDYLVATKHVKYVGKKIAHFIEKLMRDSKVPIGNIHLIGIGLGAHVSGFAGKKFNHSNYGPLARITGLDPLGIHFRGEKASKRLAKDDAVMVDVTHTNPGFTGYDASLGSVDFFVNPNKKDQPGCDYKFFPINDEEAHCNHVRAWKLYAESIKTKFVVKNQKDEEAIYGEHIEPNTKGNFELISYKDTPPYLET